MTDITVLVSDLGNDVTLTHLKSLCRRLISTWNMTTYMYKVACFRMHQPMSVKNCFVTRSCVRANQVVFISSFKDVAATLKYYSCQDCITRQPQRATQIEYFLHLTASVTTSTCVGERKLIRYFTQRANLVTVFINSCVVSTEERSIAFYPFLQYNA